MTPNPVTLNYRTCPYCYSVTQDDEPCHACEKKPKVNPNQLDGTRQLPKCPSLSDLDSDFS